jgi:hypothetical protein
MPARARTLISELICMSPVTRIVAVLLTLAVTACATAPAADPTPPPRQQMDAKTQLETGRKY